MTKAPAFNGHGIESSKDIPGSEAWASDRLAGVVRDEAWDDSGMMDDGWCYTIHYTWDLPTPKKSPPGLWNNFSRGSQPKPLFAAVTGGG